MNRLARVLVSVAVAALLAAPSLAAKKSQWQALNEALAPINVELQGAIAEADPSLTKVTEAVGAILGGAPIDFAAMKQGSADLESAIKDARAVLVRIKDNAKAAIAVLDDFGTEPCYRHFWAVSYTGYAALWDFADLALNSESIGGAFSTGLYAFGPMAEDEWAAVDCE